ncbi:MAG: DUF697 domain-containing protein [Betaproteobacteria bacterium]|nr:DUF697 domain-containing protein [Betaproteobacteria bacterium]
MAITRAKKPATTAPKGAATPPQRKTPEQFIAGAQEATEPPMASQQLPMVIGPHEAPALALVKSYLPWAMGAAVMPFPGIDLAMINGVQVRLLARLCEEYGLPFKEKAAWSIASALMATVAQNTTSGGFVFLLKFIPGFGTALGMAALPPIAAASTFALGRAFIEHFEAGGGFLDVDTEKVRIRFQEEFENARWSVRLPGVPGRQG